MLHSWMAHGDVQVEWLDLANNASSASGSSEAWWPDLCQSEGCEARGSAGAWNTCGILSLRDEQGLGAECCTWCAHPHWQPRDLLFQHTVQSPMIYRQQLMKMRASLCKSWGPNSQKANSGAKYVMDYYSVDLTTLEDANKNDSAGDGSSTARSTDCPSTTLSPSIPTVFPVASLLNANVTDTGLLSMTDANIGENTWSDSEDGQTEVNMPFPSELMSAEAILDIGPPPGLPIPPALQARFEALRQS